MSQLSMLVQCPTCGGSGHVPPVDEPAVGKMGRGASDTQRAAAWRVYPRTGTQRRRILELLLLDGPLTDEQIHVRTRIAMNSVRPRRGELVDGGWVEDSSARARTEAGEAAIMWRPTDGAIRRFDHGGSA